MQRCLLAFAISAGVLACGGDDPVDEAPIAVDDVATTAEDTPVLIDVLANDRDPEGEALRLVRVTAYGQAATVEGNQVRLVPGENFHGNIELSYVVSDGDRSATGQASVTVTPVNDAPVAVVDRVRTGRNAPVAVRLAGTDVDGDALTFAVASEPANGTITGTGTGAEVTYRPAMGFTGTDSFTYVARDGSASSAPATITVDVLEGAVPVAYAQTVVTLEDTAKAVTLVATDADGDALSYLVTVPPMHGTLTGTIPALTYTPAADYVGPDTFRFTASDGLLTSPPATVSITVTADNDPPVAQSQTVTLAEDIPRVIILGGSDPEGSPLTYAIVDPPAHGTLTGTGGTRTYLPAANYHGVDSFTFTVSDGFLTSAPATVTLGIDSVPDAPVATPQTVAAIEDVPLVITLAGTDGDGDELSFTIVSGPAHGTLSGDPPSMTYTPAANYHGSDAITFTVSDRDHTSQPVTIPITIAPVDDPPVLIGTTMMGAEGELILIPLPVTDVDGEVLTYAVATHAPHGNLYLTGPERFYREWGNYHGVDSFALTASDGHTTSAPATFTVIVTPMPDAPIARDDLAIATPGQDLRIAVLANDVEVDGEEMALESVTAPVHGSVEIDGDEVVYRPQPGNLAPDTFTYTVADPGGLTDTATVTIGIGEFPSGLAPRLVGRVVNVASSSTQVLQHDVSADGRYTAVLASIGHTPGDTNGLNDVYVWDRMASRWERVSVAADGGLANGASERPSISDDGRYVAFASAASNLVADDTNGSVDVFVRDRVTGTTVRASVGPGGAQVSGTSREPDLSADGSVVAFQSTSFQLIPSDANGASDIFVRDLVAGTTTRVSTRTGGGEADFGAFEAAISGDGRVVAFTSAASNLVSGDTNNTGDVFVHDRTSGITERVSVSSTGGEGNNLSQGPAISFDGRFVGFRTSATNLIPGANSGGTLVRDRHAITTTVAASGTVAISISGDGRYLAGHMSNGSSFVRDRFAGVTHLYTGSSGNDAFCPVISRNGRYVLLVSNHELEPETFPSGTNAWLFANPL